MASSAEDTRGRGQNTVGGTRPRISARARQATFNDGSP